jgi:hypothetical protein
LSAHHRSAQGEAVIVQHRSLPPPSGYSLLPGKQALIGLSPIQPSRPTSSPDLSIMKAWLDAVHDGRNPVAAVETAVRQAQEGQGRRILGRYYYRVPADIRPLMAQSDGEGLKSLLGTWTHQGFQEGVAGLSEREAEAYSLRIRGWSSSAIAHQLTHPRQRFDRRLWVRVETVYQYCWRAKCKVLSAFGLPAPSQLEEDAI